MSTAPDLKDLVHENVQLLKENAKIMDKLLRSLESEEHFLERRLELEVNGARADGYRLRQQEVIAELGQTRILAWKIFGSALERQSGFGYEDLKEIAAATHMHVCFVDQGEHRELI